MVDTDNRSFRLPLPRDLNFDSIEDKDSECVQDEENVDEEYESIMQAASDRLVAQGADQTSCLRGSQKSSISNKRLMFTLTPERDVSEASYYHRLRWPLSDRFSEGLYISSVLTKAVAKDQTSSKSKEKVNLSEMIDPKLLQTSLSDKTKDLLLNKSVIKEVESKVAADAKMEITPKLGRKALKKLKQSQRESTKGAEWFGMKAPEVTEEVKRELDVLKMRSVINPKRFYKKNDSSTLPKYFQIGRVIDAPTDYYSNRASSKDKKKSLVDELLADAEFKRFSKRKYVEIITKKNERSRKRSKKSNTATSK